MSSRKDPAKDVDKATAGIIQMTQELRSILPFAFANPHQAKAIFDYDFQKYTELLKEASIGLRDSKDETERVHWASDWTLYDHCLRLLAYIETINFNQRRLTDELAQFAEAYMTHNDGRIREIGVELRRQAEEVHSISIQDKKILDALTGKRGDDDKNA